MILAEVRAICEVPGSPAQASATGGACALREELGQEPAPEEASFFAFFLGTVSSGSASTVT
jgi:hypothetical protein